ncbi:unnamed protein product [Porites evermanni]|uniref:XPG N-terminal domain-containing protein n=1 Tax=Porites evermanni TaxID=104178 RepID=A0ABN8MAR5_9CNID|nr:unnamed protein product [Porites evermanni]
MGITGLLTLLKDITCDVHLRSFSGKVAAIDVYCWLHITVIFCVEEIILGSKQRALFSPQTFFFRYIDMCMKDTDLLIENNVQPILVFQKNLVGKANVESSSANLLLLRTTQTTAS